LSKDHCPACQTPAAAGANYCSHCGLALNGEIVVREEITVYDGDSGVEETSGLKISVDTVDDDTVSFSMRLPRHEKQVLEDQAVGDITRYAAGPDGLLEVKVLDVSYDDSEATFLVTLTRGK